MCVCVQHIYFWVESRVGMTCKLQMRHVAKCLGPSPRAKYLQECFLFQPLFHSVPSLHLSLRLRFTPDVALFGHTCFGLRPTDLRRVWCHALFKGKAMRTGSKGEHSGPTSKLLSRTVNHGTAICVTDRWPHSLQVLTNMSFSWSSVGGRVFYWKESSFRL